MTTIHIEADETLVSAIKQVANDNAISMEDLIKKILSDYVKQKSDQTKKYSFIGIGHSNKKDLSSRVDEILRQGVNRRQGWSLPE